MMSDAPLIAFILLSLLFSGIFCLLFWKYVKVQKGIAIVATVLYLFLAVLLLFQVNKRGIQVIQVGNWPAPFGISLVADMLSCLMVLVTAIIAIAILWYTFQDVSEKRKAGGFYSLFFFMLFGINGSFLTGDIFNLYVWFEVMLVASFVLMSIGSSKAQLEGAVKYVILNFVGSGFFLMGVGITYKLTGALNMAELAIIIPQHDEVGLITLAAIFFLMAFGIKAAVFPLFFWLPASYHTPPISIAALMAGLLTKVGVYALIRFFTLIFVQDVGFTHTLLLIISGFTMFTGVLGAIAQTDFRKILSFHIISQIGYMIMGLALYTPLALAGAIFYVLHHILVKTNLFLISGLVRSTQGSYLLKDLGGVYKKYPLISILFVISAFSLAGVPPLSGFWSKFFLVQAGLEIEQYVIVVVSLVVGLLTLFSMSKIWKEAFLAKEPEEVPEKINLFKKLPLMLFPVIFLAACTVFLSFFPQVLFSLSETAAEQLLNGDAYINAVLNK